MSAKIDWLHHESVTKANFCDTCCHQFSDICGGCEGLDGVPVNYENRPIDKITLREAVETDAWLMVWAGEPGRNINVQMTYADLWEIRKWIGKKTKKNLVGRA